MRSGHSSTPATSFGLAPTSTGVRVLTWIVLAVPLVLFLGTLEAFGPARSVLFGVTLLVLFLYASVRLLWRPTAFEIDASGLRIRWPLRVRAIPVHELTDAVILSGDAFRHEFGWGMRIGAGGLWGGFGWLYTRKGLLDLYVSRTDRFVLVRLRTGRPLLLTPDADERFVAALRAEAPRDAPGRRGRRVKPGASLPCTPPPREGTGPREGSTMRTWMRPMVAAVIGLTAASGCATAPTGTEDKAAMSRDVGSALARANVRDPSLQALLDKAHGYAIFPAVAKGAVGVGGAYGKGEVFERGRRIGYCDLSQATIGLAVGGQTYTEIIVFENKAALDNFKAGNVKFAGQATAVGLKAGSGANAQYRDGVQVLTVGEQGLMLEASIGGQTFTFQPL